MKAKKAKPKKPPRKKTPREEAMRQMVKDDIAELQRLAKSLRKKLH
ncbi:hypothetical protein [Bradyrhizobium yuanmingense]|nr:hypothetical protein [Bradyrhizobium yuanmingense]